MKLLSDNSWEPLSSTRIHWRVSFSRKCNILTIGKIYLIVYESITKLEQERVLINYEASFKLAPSVLV